MSLQEPRMSIILVPSDEYSILSTFMICSLPSAILTFVPTAEFLKALPPILRTDEGIVMDFRFGVSEKAIAPISSRPSFSLMKLIPDLLKALSSIYLTVEGKVIDSRFSVDAKAYWPIFSRPSFKVIFLI